MRFASLRVNHCHYRSESIGFPDVLYVRVVLILYADDVLTSVRL